MIKLDKVSKKFGTGTFALSDISLNVDKGEFVFLVGSTGAGKTTIFRLLIREFLPTEGNIFVNEWDVVNLPKNKIPTLRKNVGVIFQDLKLFLDRTIFENIMLPLEVAGAGSEEATKIVDAILAQVGLVEHRDKFPIQLSGGEVQRVAIARALVLSPQILLADEPTGNLDMATSWEIIKLLSDINKKGTTVIMATHNQDVIKSSGKRVIHIEKGKIISEEKGKKNSSSHKTSHVAEVVDEKPEEKMEEKEDNSKEDKKQ